MPRREYLDNQLANFIEIITDEHTDNKHLQNPRLAALVGWWWQWMIQIVVERSFEDWS